MWAQIRRYFVSGLVVFLPLALTVFLFIWVINLADGLLGKYIQPVLKETLGFYVPGLGLLLGVALIVLIGFLAKRFIGARIQGGIENLFLRLPFFKQVYPAVKEIALFFFSRDKISFKKVVLVEYPRKEMFSFGFLTNDSSEKMNQMTRYELCNVFIPSTPSPLTGFVVMVPKKDIIVLDISVEEAAKFIMSGGVINPM